MSASHAASPSPNHNGIVRHRRDDHSTKSDAELGHLAEMANATAQASDPLATRTDAHKAAALASAADSRL